MTKNGEQAKSLALYMRYEGMGPDRTLEKLAQEIFQAQSKPTPKYITTLSKLKKLSAQHNWVTRAEEYDKRQVEALRKKQQEAIDRMNEEHALLGRTHALRAAKQIQELMEAKKFGSNAVVSLLKVATDLERVARGAETTNSKVTVEDHQRKPHVVSVDLSKLSDEQLARLETLVTEIESPKEGGE